MSQVLIVEDERVLAKNLKAKLAAHGHEVSVVHSGEQARGLFSKNVPDVVLLDVRLPGIDGISLLPELKAQSPSSSFVVMTAHGSERVAVDAMRAGAFEYLTKPIDLEELVLVVDRAVEHQRMSDNLLFLRSQQERSSGLERIIGESAATRSLRETIQRLTRAEVLALPDPPTVLLTGETGCGKDLVARAVHYDGPRRAKSFIQVNCTALPASLFESELFGHVSGAFTSASKAKRGLFEVAEGGTIFLDEIGHLDLEMQAKLLQTIEHREIRPVGGTEHRPINVHIIAATNRDLNQAIAAGEFRMDLYHRLRVVEIKCAPLRDRQDDIRPLAEHFLTTHCRRFGFEQKALSDDAMRLLVTYRWPGNVRELSHVIESAVLQVEAGTIEPQDLHLEEAGVAEGGFQVKLPDQRTITIDFDSGATSLEEVEQAILQAAFEYWDHNLSRAARSLGITREALRYRLNKGTTAARDHR